MLWPLYRDTVICSTVSVMWCLVLFNTCSHSWTFILSRLLKPSLAEAALFHLLQLCLHCGWLHGSGVDLRWNIHMHSHALFLVLFTTCHNTSHLNTFSFCKAVSCSWITVRCCIYLCLCWYYYNMASTYEVVLTAGVRFQFSTVRSLMTRLLLQIVLTVNSIGITLQ